MTLYVSDFRKTLVHADNDPLRVDVSKTIGKDSDPLYIKKYISLEEKIKTINSICSYSDYMKGLSFQIFRVYFITKAYVDDVNFPQMKDTFAGVDEDGNEVEKTRMIDDIQQIVNIMLGSGLWDRVLEYAERDIAFIDTCIDEEIETYRQSTDIMNGLHTLISHIDDIVMDARDKGLTEIVISEAEKIRKALNNDDQKKAAQDILSLLKNDTGVK